MRLTCPICGERDRREFYYQGHALALDRPAPDAGEAAWDAYVHLRDNPAGDTRDLWQHEAGCGAWVVVSRNTLTHEIHDTALVTDAKGAS
jgi:sarcosine oxidase subunit delta